MVIEGSWLVGLGFHTSCGRLVRHFYVVDGIADPEHAREAALEKSAAPGERAARGGLRLVDGCVEIRRVMRDLLGVRRLSAPSPCRA
jgi:hypothetical protein